MKALLVLVPASFLFIGCAPRVVVLEKPYPLPAPDSEKVRIPDRVHAYNIGRLPTHDRMGMDEAHKYYRIEESAHWDLRLPNKPMRSTGPVTAFRPPTARKMPYSKELDSAQANLNEVTGKLMQAREGYLTAKGELQKRALDAEKSETLAATYQNLLRSEKEENERLKTENERLRGINEVPPAAPKSGTDDPYKRLEQWGTK